MQLDLRKAALLPAIIVALNGCRAVAGIFKAGVWTGVVVVVALIALVGGGIAALRR